MALSHQKEVFSTELKGELCRITAAQVGMALSGDSHFDDCCSVSFLRAVLIYAGKKFNSGYVIRSENSALLEICAYLLIKYYNIEAQVAKVGTRPSSGYKLTLTPSDRVSSLIDSLYIADNSDITLKDFLCKNCFKAFMRGAFLSCGTMLDPQKGYHLELASYDSLRLNALSKRLSENGVVMKRSQRKNMCLIYMKGSEQIEDFLTLIGGGRYALRIMEIKIERDQRNSETRHNNSIVANMDRACTYAAQTVRAIYALRKAGKFDLLPEVLRETALLREQNPSASLNELCSLSGEKLTKSGLNHRLQKIMSIAAGLEDDGAKGKNE